MVELDGLVQVRDGAFQIAGLKISIAEGIAQHGAVLSGRQHGFEVGDDVHGVL